MKFHDVGASMIGSQVSIPCAPAALLQSSAKRLLMRSELDGRRGLAPPRGLAPRLSSRSLCWLSALADFIPGPGPARAMLRASAVRHPAISFADLGCKDHLRPHLVWPWGRSRRGACESALGDAEFPKYAGQACTAAAQPGAMACRSLYQHVRQSTSSSRSI